MATKPTTKNKKTEKAVAVKDVQATLESKQADLIGYKKGLRIGELKNPSVIRTTRKEIARLKTAQAMEKISNKEGDK